MRALLAGVIGLLPLGSVQAQGTPLDTSGLRSVRVAQSNTMLRWHPAVGFHMGGPLRAALAAGGFRVTKGGDTSTGYTVLAEPGLDGVKLRVARARIGPFFMGYAFGLSALRTWREGAGAADNSTYAGPEGRLMFFAFNLGGAVFVPLARRDGRTPFVAATGGIGF